MRDLELSLRALRRQPLVSLLAIVILALGIGATTAIFTVVRTVLLNPLPYTDAERLVRIHGTHQARGIETFGLSGADFVDFEGSLKAFDFLGAHRWFGLALTGSDRPRELRTIMVTHGVLDTLGEPLLGRTFTAEECQPGQGAVVVLGHGLWRSEFGQDPDILGRELQLDGRPHTVVGVMPPGFSVPVDGIELWVPWTYDPARLGRDTRFWSVLGRLAPGVTLEQGRDDLRAAALALERQFPQTNDGWSATAVPLREEVVSGARAALLLLQGAVLLVLAVACANVAGLLLARGVGRRQEMALRSALGATRGQLIGQFLTESLLLASAGGALGVILAQGAVGAVVRVPPQGLPRVQEIAIDAPLLAFALAVTLITGLACGILPALRVTDGTLFESLQDGGQGAEGPRDGREGQGIRRAITVVQVALSLVLLVGAGLLLRSVQRLNTVDPGFDPEGRVALQLFVYDGRYDDPEQQRMFYERLLEELRALPGVRSAAGVSAVPLSPLSSGLLSVHVEGRAEVEGVLTSYRLATPGYFATMGTALVAGRDFTPADRDPGTPVAILNETAAQHYFPAGDALGSRLRTFWGEAPGTDAEDRDANDGGDGIDRDGRVDGIDRDDRGPAIEIVGIVHDVRHQSLSSEPVPELFRPFRQEVSGMMSVVVETDGDTEALMPSIQDRVWEVDAAQPIWDSLVFETLVEQDTAGQRLQSFLVSLFAAVAVLLAAVGLYGVMTYSVARRTQEIGLRMALGADTGGIARMVLGQGIRLLGAGLALGLMLTFGLITLFSRLLTPLLFEVSARDPVALAVACVLMTLLGLVASLIPAVRASRVDPMRALRHG